MMIIKIRPWMAVIAVIVLSLISINVGAIETITNGFPTSQQGYWRVDVDDGGESRTVHFTGTGTPSGTVFADEEIVFDYFSYVDTGSGGVRLSNTTVTTPVNGVAPGVVVSEGNFMGSAGNVINWTMRSSIAAGSSIMFNELTLTAATGILGTLDFYQYLDEDVLGNGDDVFFTRGSAGLDLELFTIDNTEAIGVSHSGAQSGAQGLVDAVFTGYAACRFDSMRPAISAGTQSVSFNGVICSDLNNAQITHPIVGPAFGPIDVVSVVAWTVNSSATTATIISTIGGVPDITVVIGPAAATDVPTLNNLMLALLILLLGAAGLRFAHRRQMTV